MSLLPSAVFATSITPGPGPSDYAANALWATNGSAGPGGGVTQLVAGANITLDPPTGDGVVTITASGGGAGGVTSVTSGGPGITCTPTTGAVVVDNTGVTSLVAGPGIAVSGTTGAVTVSTVGLPVFTGVQTFTYNGGPGSVTYTPTGNAFKILFQRTGGSDVFVAAPSGWRTTSAITLTNPAWNADTFIMVQIGGAIGFLSPPGISTNYCGGTASCGRSPGTPATDRSLVVAGSGPAPSDIGFGGTFGDSFLYCLVFQAAP